MLCAMACFTACSDDDDNNGGGNGNGAGNGGSGVEVKERKLVRVEEQEGNDGTKYITHFAYDSEGRLSKITESPEDGSYEDEQTVTYGDGQITVAGEYDEDVYVLNGDGDVQTLSYDYEEDREDCTYTYSNGYLSRITYAYYEYVDGEWVKEESEEVTEYVVSDGNLSKVFSNDYNEEYEMTVEMSSTPNNMNIDYLYDQWLGSESEFLLCIAGKRYQNLPARITWEGYARTYEYTVDGDGYVTKAVEKNGNQINTYRFYYE